MKTLTLLIVALLGGTLGAAEVQTLFFARETAGEFTRIALTIDGDQVSGTQVSQRKGGRGSRGILSGIATAGGILQVIHESTIEGVDQSEEAVLKLAGDSLYLGEGELVKAGNGRMNLKAPNQVAFKQQLRKVAVTEPAPGSPERKAIMDAMRGPVARQVGKPVIFTGDVRVSGGWARFQGNVAPTDGKPPKSEEAAAELELDFFALLKKDAQGTWQVVHRGFAGDISVRDEAREKFPEAAWVLFE